MLDYVSGTVQSIHEKTVVIDVYGFGLTLQTPALHTLNPGEHVRLHTHLHWNQEQGPSLYGFIDELTRSVFLTIIECPKIGPSIALNILSHINALHFLNLIAHGNEKQLCAVNGIGAKKAEQLIVQLKHKAAKLLTTQQVSQEAIMNFIPLQQVSDVLTSLNYSKAEVAQALRYISEKHHEQTPALDILLRSALSHLATLRSANPS